MFQLSGIETIEDQKLIKRYCHFVFSKFPVKLNLRKALIKIEVVNENDIPDSTERKELKESGAWTIYDGILNDKKTFTITMNRKSINDKAKKKITQYKYFLKWLGHELVHVKQYLTGQMFDYVNGETKFEGKIYAANDAKHLNEAYWFSPWEIEAYGCQEGLYHLFVEELKKKK